MNYLQQVYKGKNDVWRYLLSFFTIMVGSQIIGVIPLMVVSWQHSEDLKGFLIASESNFTSLGIDSNLYLFLMLVTFAIGLVFLIFSIKYIHQRSIKSLVTSREKIDWKRFFFAFATWFLFSGIIILVYYYNDPENFTWNFKPMPFFILVMISFIFLPLQTSFEELFFRGYLMQGLGDLSKNRLFPLLFTSILFGLLHMANPEVQKLGSIIMIYYIGTGLFLGMLTLLDEGLELAMGYHAANNIVAAILVTNTWSVFQTEALLIDNAEPTIGLETFLPVFVIYPLLLLLFSKKYKWSNWKEKLFGKIINPKFSNR